MTLLSFHGSILLILFVLAVFRGSVLRMVPVREVFRRSILRVPAVLAVVRADSASTGSISAVITARTASSRSASVVRTAILLGVSVRYTLDAPSAGSIVYSLLRAFVHGLSLIICENAFISTTIGYVL